MPEINPQLEKLKYDVSSHFRFGKNWRDYAELIDEERIESARKDLLFLIPGLEDWRGRTFFDIGCGSGLHSLAATRLGIASVSGIDIDPESVTTAQSVFRKFAVEIPWDFQTGNILSEIAMPAPTFDIVYSWGVLHHTGAMWEAIERASRYVAPGGYFVFAIYVKTATCEFWKKAKQFYVSLPEEIQRDLLMAFGSYLLMKKDDPWQFLANYKRMRGMDFWHDVHDWLGGWPYESASGEEVEAFVTRLGFKKIQIRKTRSFEHIKYWWQSSGNGLYVFRKPE